MSEVAHRPNFTERAEPLPAKPANLLPPAARDLLILASQVRDPEQRRAAIDHAIGVAQARFPQFFHLTA